MKSRKVRNKILNYVVSALRKKKIPYVLQKEDGEFSFLKTRLSSDAYHRLIERAMCLDEQENLHNGRLTISYNEYVNHEYDRAFHILRKDHDKFMRYACQGKN